MGLNAPSHGDGTSVWDVPDPHYPCRKVKYPTKGHTKLAIKQLRAIMSQWQRKDVKPTPYRCKNCGLWHWGHKREAT